MKSFFRMSYPYILWIAAFIVAPMIMILLYALTRATGDSTLTFRFTLDNFVKFFSDATFMRVLFTSLRIALFTTVFLQQWIDTKNHIPAITGLLATLVCRLIFGPDIFLIPAMIIIVITMTVMRRRIEKAELTEAAEQTEGGDGDA